MEIIHFCILDCVSRRRLASAERLLRGSQRFPNGPCDERMGASEDAPRISRQILEPRHSIAELTERRVGVRVECIRVTTPHLEHKLIRCPEKTLCHDREVEPSGPGSLHGYLSAFTGHSHHLTFTALTDARLLVLSKARLDALPATAMLAVARVVMARFVARVPASHCRCGEFDAVIYLSISSPGGS